VSGHSSRMTNSAFPHIPDSILEKQLGDLAISDVKHRYLDNRSFVDTIKWIFRQRTAKQDPDTIYVLPNVEHAGYIVKYLDSHMEETTECLRAVVQHRVPVEGL
jgi:hypothetical protein